MLSCEGQTPYELFQFSFRTDLEWKSRAGNRVLTSVRKVLPVGRLVALSVMRSIFNQCVGPPWLVRYGAKKEIAIARVNGRFW